jgi:hypothetical protein
LVIPVKPLDQAAETVSGHLHCRHFLFLSFVRYAERLNQRGPAVFFFFLFFFRAAET